MYIIIPLGIAALAAVIYLAISKTSTFKVRIAALCALGLMIATVIICMFVVFRGDPSSKVRSLPDAPPPPPQTPQTGNAAVVLLLIVFLIALFLVVTLLSLREHRRAERQRQFEAGK